MAGGASYEKPNQRWSTDIDMMKKELSDINGEISDAKNELADLKKELANAQSSISSIIGSVNSLKNNIPTVDGGITVGIEIKRNSYVDYKITFNKKFDKIPAVSVSIYSSSVGPSDYGLITCGICEGTLSQTGFTIRLFASNMESTRYPAVSWIAITK